MLSFPNAKINLGLNIVEKRLDGFHNIETIFYPVGIKDALEFVVNDDSQLTTLTISGIKVDGDLSNNLIIKAYNLLAQDFSLPVLDIYLRKQIPLGAGLGGGSADAAFMLQQLNDNFKLGLSISKLETYAAQLGSDCPFFIQNKPVFAHGRGELMQNIDLSLKDYYLLVIKPDIHVPTALAYAGCKPHKSKHDLLQVIQTPLEDWKNLMKNDFEDSIFTQFPPILDIKNKMYEEGAIYASMSGSGSSVFGIFDQEKSLKECFPSHFIWGGKLE